MNIFLLFCGIATGTFLGSWLLMPLFIKDRTHYDGFMIGTIAAILTMVFGPILHFIGIF